MNLSLVVRRWSSEKVPYILSNEIHRRPQGLSASSISLQGPANKSFSLIEVRSRWTFSSKASPLNNYIAETRLHVDPRTATSHLPPSTFEFLPCRNVKHRINHPDAMIGTEFDRHSAHHPNANAENSDPRLTAS